jgi:hypothetical protein
MRRYASPNWGALVKVCNLLPVSWPLALSGGQLPEPLGAQRFPPWRFVALSGGQIPERVTIEWKREGLFCAPVRWAVTGTNHLARLLANCDPVRWAVTGTDEEVDGVIGRVCGPVRWAVTGTKRSHCLVLRRVCEPIL